MNTPQKPPFQQILAISITVITLLGTTAFGILGIYLAIRALSIQGGGVEQSNKVLQLLFSAILPLFGTWIGTILAFYFSKESLLAANQTVQHLVETITSDKKLRSINAKSVSIPIDKLIYVSYPTGTPPTSLNLKTDFLDFLDKKKISRILLLDENKVAKYVFHKSIIQGFVSDEYFKAAAAATPGAGVQSVTAVIDALTLDHLLKSANPAIRQVLENGVKFLDENATLEDAKLLFKNSPGCNDIFITVNGRPSNPVLGWITDKTIIENSVVS